MIKIENLYLAYNKEYYALYDINLDINKGDRVAFIGPEGSGKTTLLRAIAGLEKISKGDILINDVSVKKIDFSHDLSLGYISRKPMFFEGKTVEKNLEWALKVRNVDKSEWQVQIDRVLNMFDLQKIKKERLSTLCRSDRRMVQLARLALRPLDILLVDELDLDKDNAFKSVITEGIQQLINTQPTDKIVIVVCNSEQECPSYINKKVYLKLGSIENIKWQKIIRL